MNSRRGFRGNALTVDALNVVIVGALLGYGCGLVVAALALFQDGGE
ncbi:MAG: hypothetical protein AB7O68_26210 [Pirellulales bacterium]